MLTHNAGPVLGKVEPFSSMGGWVETGSLGEGLTLGVGVGWIVETGVGVFVGKSVGLGVGCLVGIGVKLGLPALYRLQLFWLSFTLIAQEFALPAEK